jgi:hypothetical protein
MPCREKGLQKRALPVERKGKRRTHLGPVDDLVGNDDVSRTNLLPETSDGGERDDGLDPEVLEGSDVGASGNGGRRDVVVGTVTGEESDLDGSGGSRETGDGDGRGRRSPRLFNERGRATRGGEQPHQLSRSSLVSGSEGRECAR